jgi:hypothetical protein
MVSIHNGGTIDINSTLFSRVTGLNESQPLRTPGNHSSFETLPILAFQPISRVRAIFDAEASESQLDLGPALCRSGGQ